MSKNKVKVVKPKKEPKVQEVLETKDILIAGKYPAKEVIQKKEVKNNMMSIEELRTVMKPHSNKVTNLPRCLSL